MKLFGILLSITGIALGIWQGWVFFTLAMGVSMVISVGDPGVIARQGGKLSILQSILFIIHWSIYTNWLMIVIVGGFLVFELINEVK